MKGAVFSDECAYNIGRATRRPYILSGCALHAGGLRVAMAVLSRRDGATTDDGR